MPWQLNGEDVRITILGTNEEFEEWMRDFQKEKIPFKVDSLGAATFVPSNPLSELTERQKDILLKAYRAGYYSIPRKATLEGLASSFGIDESTVAEHIRKAESILITRVITNAHIFAPG
ncbi:MAG: helix-turn-helix domain-containing protein [Nitrososphaerota archaeon]|nr:helix-turn-helix domain-containing protein [Nitrososphaerota archaeon]